jgi:hypothetical protein
MVKQLTILSVAVGLSVGVLASAAVANDTPINGITPPTEFSSSPNLPDQVSWTGDTSVDTVSDATGMGSYESSKIELGMADRYDLTATGSTWFKTSSVATMGGSKAFPGGNYTALVNAECIAQ